jgi:hypothetical protein
MIMKLRRAVSLILILLLLTSVGACAGAQSEASLLFVQVASEGSLTKLGDAEDAYLLTLYGVGQSTIWFTDRPDRNAGHMQTGQLVDNWAVGENNFAANPPNAALDILDGTDEADLLIIELFNPEYDAASGTLSYRVKILTDADGGLEAFNTRADHAAAIPAQFGHAALFIDNAGDEVFQPSRVAYGNDGTQSDKNRKDH